MHGMLAIFMFKVISCQYLINTGSVTLFISENVCLRIQMQTEINLRSLRFFFLYCAFRLIWENSRISQEPLPQTQFACQFVFPEKGRLQCQMS